MVESGIRVGGAVTLWSVATHYDKTRLRQSLDSLMLGHFCPLKRADSMCLKDAIEERAGAKNRLVLPLKGGQGFVVKQTKAGEEDVDMDTMLTVRLVGNGLDFLVDRLGVEQSVRNEFSFQQTILTGAQVSQMLIRIAKGLNAQTLRESGGVYWLKPQDVELWAKLGKAVEDAATRGKAAVYLIRTVMDDDAVRAVYDAVFAEVSAEAEKMAAEIDSGTLGDKALENRALRLLELGKRVEQFEELLGRNMDSLSQMLDEITDNAAKGRLLGQALAMTE